MSLRKSASNSPTPWQFNSFIFTKSTDVAVSLTSSGMLGSRIYYHFRKGKMSHIIFHQMTHRLSVGGYPPNLSASNEEWHWLIRC